MNQSDVNKIIELYFKGELSPKYQNLVALWLGIDGNSDAKDEALKKLWTQVDGNMEQDKVHESWTTLETNIDDYEYRTRRRRAQRKVLRYAAIFLLPVVTAVLAWFGSSYFYGGQGNMVECFVPDGKTQTLYLADNTKVQLNGGSRIIYPEKFGPWSKRNVFVEGEAHFEVAHDARHPFIVNVDNVDVRVFGTHFNVRAYRDEENIITTLEEGSVVVSDGVSAVTLKPNQQAIYNKCGRMFDKVAVPAGENVWTSGDLNFEHKPLRYIMATIGHRYGVKFDVGPDIELDKAYTINFEATEHIEDVLKVFNLLEKDRLTFTLKNNRILIFKQGKEVSRHD